MHAYRLLIVLGLGVLSGCSMLGHKQLAAKTTLEPRSGSAVTGKVRIAEHDGIVRIAGTVRGLEPKSEHGFHIHEKGDCSAADASSAGGHFNPGGTAHGAYNAAVHHGGDLASLKAGASGQATFDFVVTGVTLGEGPTSIKGRSLVVHGKADDFTTQPSGNSGPRVACGVI
jgi:superoxide dismutase, Cu-Zn family